MNQDIWRKIAEYARMSPSPHNTQPFRLRPVNDNMAEVVFLPSRGLYVGDPLGRFTWLAGGIFVEICEIAAHNLGYATETRWDFEPMYPNGDHETPQTVARIQLTKKSVEDIDAGLILKRQTSRLPYEGSKIPEDVISELQAIADKYGHSFKVSSEPKDIAWVKRLNKDSLFNDLENRGIREELKGWLRFSRKQARKRKDGLSAECLVMPGWLLKSFFYHHRVWTMPGLKQFTEKVYLSTMKGIGTIGWLQGPYVDSQNWVTAGKVMIRMWLKLTEKGLYWHPYGSVITNDKSRTDMLKYLGLPDEAGGKNMVWLLLRMGHSAKPPKSERLPIEEVLI